MQQKAFWKRDRYQPLVILYLVSTKEGVDANKITSDQFKLDVSMTASADMLQLPALTGASPYALDRQPKKESQDEEDDDVPKLEKAGSKRKSTGGDSRAGAETKSKVSKVRGTSKADVESWKKALSTGVAAATVMEISMQPVPFVAESCPQCDMLCSVGCVLSWAWRCAWQSKVCHA